MTPDDAHAELADPPARRLHSADEWFRRFPNGGTVYQSPPTPRSNSVTYFRRCPTGGTTYLAAGASRAASDADGGGGENGTK